MSTTESKKGWLKSSIKSFVATFVLSFVATMCLLAYNTIQKTKDDIWRELGCPYDIKKEYLDNNLYTTIREKLVEYGFSDDNFISNLIKDRQLVLIQAIEQKIPADDSIMEGIHYRYFFSPTKNYKQRTISITDLQKLKVILTNLINKTSSSNRFWLKDRYVYIMNIAKYLSVSSNLKNEIEIFNEVWSQCDSQNPGTISFFYEANACLAILKLQYDSMEYVPCNSEVTAGISDYLTKINRYLATSSNELKEPMDLQMLSSFKDFKHNYSTWLFKNCPQNKIIQ
jgi:hypothetical protein